MREGNTEKHVYRSAQRSEQSANKRSTLCSELWQLIKERARNHGCYKLCWRFYCWFFAAFFRSRERFKDSLSGGSGSSFFALPPVPSPLPACVTAVFDFFSMFTSPCSVCHFVPDSFGNPAPNCKSVPVETQSALEPRASAEHPGFGAIIHPLRQRRFNLQRHLCNGDCHLAGEHD